MATSSFKVNEVIDSCPESLMHTPATSQKASSESAHGSDIMHSCPSQVLSRASIAKHRFSKPLLFHSTAAMDDEQWNPRMYQGATRVEVESEDVWVDSPQLHQYLDAREQWITRHLARIDTVKRYKSLDLDRAVEDTRPSHVAASTSSYAVHQLSSMASSTRDYLQDRADQVSEVLKRSKTALGRARSIFIQNSKFYCATQKMKLEADKDALTGLATSLYLSKRTLCEVLVEHIQLINDLTRTTQQLLEEDEGIEEPMMCGLSQILNEDRASDPPPLTDDLGSDSPRGISRPISPAHSSSSHRVSEDEYEVVERLSYYIQEKLAAYHDSLKSLHDLTRHHPRSAASHTFIGLSFLTKPRVLHRYSSLDSMIPKQAPPSRVSIRGYMMMKTIHDDWTRSFLNIRKDNGVLVRHRAYRDPEWVVDLKTVTVRVLDHEQRDFTLQLVSTLNDSDIVLQAETAFDHSHWFQALSSWSVTTDSSSKKLATRHSANPLHDGKCDTTVPFTSSNSSSSSSSGGGSGYGTGNPSTGSGRSSFMTKRPSFSAVNLMTDNTFKMKGEISTTRNSHKRSSFGVGAFSTVTGRSGSGSACLAACTMGFSSAIIKSSLLRMRESCHVRPSKLSIFSAGKQWYSVQAVLLADGLLHVQAPEYQQDDYHHTIQLGTLQRQQIYLLSETVYNSPYCVVVRLSDTESYHLMIPKEERDQWLVLLKLYCIPDLAYLQGTFPYRSGRTLSVRILEARQLHIKDSHELFCDVVVDHEKRGTTGTTLAKSSSSFWREEFVFTDIMEIQHGISIHVMSRNSKQKESSLGSVFLSARCIGNNNMQEEWRDIRKEQRHRTIASLASLGHSQSDTPAGELKIGWRLDSQIILPLHCYKDLIQLLSDEACNETIYEIARRTSEFTVLATNLTRIYEGLGQAIPWIRTLLDDEIDSLHTDDTNLLFRGNSLLTKVIDTYMKTVAKTYLDDAIGGLIRKLCKEKAYVEVEPARFTKEESLSEHCQRLFRYAQNLWESVHQSRSRFPLELRAIFSYLQSAVIKKFGLDPKGQTETARYTCISGFIFLRLICPAIISPKLFGLVRDHPDAQTSRTLTLLAKCLMNLANLVDPSPKETWMLHLSKFIQRNSASFKDYIDFVSNSSHSPLLDKKKSSSLSQYVSDEILAEKTVEDIAVPPYFVDLPLELAQFCKLMVHTWKEAKMVPSDGLYSVCKALATEQGFSDAPFLDA